MAELEYYRDEDGNACARGDDDRLATFLQTDLQDSTQTTKHLIGLLEGTDTQAEFNGNAHTVSISTKLVTIDANFHDEAAARRLPREQSLEQVKAWYQFISDHAALS